MKRTILLLLIAALLQISCSHKGYKRLKNNGFEDAITQFQKLYPDCKKSILNPSLSKEEEGKINAALFQSAIIGRMVESGMMYEHKDTLEHVANVIVACPDKKETFFVFGEYGKEFLIISMSDSETRVLMRSH